MLPRTPAPIAIHETNDPASGGRESTGGCIHVDAGVRRPARVLPLGTAGVIVR